MRQSTFFRGISILVFSVFFFGCNYMAFLQGPEGPQGPPGEDPTEGPATITGTITFDYDTGYFDFDGKPYYVLIDNNNDLTDGVVKSKHGTIPGTSGDTSYVTQFNYYVKDVQEGAYYVFAYVDVNEDGSYNKNDDYGNYYGVRNYEYQYDGVIPGGANAAVSDTGYVVFDISLAVPGT